MTKYIEVLYCNLCYEQNELKAEVKLAYQYKLRPDKEQKLLLNSWLEKLRLQYNYLLRQRFDWWEQNRCPINACPLICHLPELKEQPSFYAQKRELVPLKQERPWYGDIYSNVLQDMVAKVEKAFNRYIAGDENGKRSGKPRFKNKTRYRSFTYPNPVRLIGEPASHKTPEIKVRLPMIGDVRMILHRPIPDGFDIKQATITHKADGWHLTLIIEAPTVPDAPVSVLEEISVTQDNSLGIDVGIEYFCYPSEGEPVSSPRNYRKSEKKLAKIYRKKDKRPHKSKGRRRLAKKASRLHQKIARKRKQHHFETAKKIVLLPKKVIFVEKLNIHNLVKTNKPIQDERGNYLPNGQSAKSGLAKSILDSGWGQFLDILTCKAENAGKLVLRVNPSGTSQKCPDCHKKVPKKLNIRIHDCPHCGYIAPRDKASSEVIRQVGVGGFSSLKNARIRELSKEKKTFYGKRKREAHTIPLVG